MFVDRGGRRRSQGRGCRSGTGKGRGWRGDTKQDWNQCKAKRSCYLSLSMSSNAAIRKLTLVKNVLELENLAVEAAKVVRSPDPLPMTGTSFYVMNIRY